VGAPAVHDFEARLRYVDTDTLAAERQLCGAGLTTAGADGGQLR
jgi:hypothetical protein